MTIKQTSVNVNLEKWHILKERGYKLQDIIDMAFDKLLEIDVIDTVNYEEEKNKIMENMKLLKQQYDIKLNGLNNQKKNLKEEIEEINLEIKELKKEYDSKSKGLELQIEAINKNIAAAKEEAKKEEVIKGKKLERLIKRNNEFNELVQLLKPVPTPEYEKHPEFKKFYDEYHEEFNFTERDLLKKLFKGSWQQE